MLASENTFAEQFTAALAWWRDAGLDYAFADDAIHWLAEPVANAPSSPAQVSAKGKASAPSAEPVLPQIGGDAAVWPSDLPLFQAWWLTEPTLDNGQVMRRVPPRGALGAEVMILVPEPEADDQARLFSGPLGKMLDAILAAMALAEDRIYLASALPRHTPMADWAALQRGGLGKIVSHHITLAAPKRILVLGNHILPLLGNDPAKNSADSTIFTHVGGQIPILSAPALESLRPRAKARLWQDWLDGTR